MRGLATRRMRRVELLQQQREPVDLVEVVDHDQPHPHLERHPQLGLGLGVAVHHDPLGRIARVQRQMQLARGGDVAPQSLPREQAQHGRAGERLGGEHDVEIRVAALPARLHERPCPRAQVVLGDDVRRRSVLARELDRVAPADLQPTPLVQAAVERERRAESALRGSGSGGHPLIIAGASRPGRLGARA